MNNKGFTLIELLFVVVLMAIIAMITMPNIFEMLGESKETKYEEYEKLVIENLKLYNIDHRQDLWNGNTNPVTIDSSVLLAFNPDINIEGCTIKSSKISKSGSNYTYSVCLQCEEDKLYGTGC